MYMWRMRVRVRKRHVGQPRQGGCVNTRGLQSSILQLSIRSGHARKKQVEYMEVLLALCLEHNPRLLQEILGH